MIPFVSLFKIVNYVNLLFQALKKGPKRIQDFLSPNNGYS